MKHNLVAIIVVTLSLYMTCTASVDFVYNLQENTIAPSGRILFEGSYLFVLPGMEEESVEFTLQPVSGSAFGKVYISHSKYTDERYHVVYKTGDSWVTIDNVFSHYAFDGTTAIPIIPAEPITLKIVCAPGFTGYIRSLKIRYYSAQPDKTVTLSQQYADIQDSRIIVTGKGLFHDASRDRIALKKAERAALLDAYRTMILRVRELAQQERFKLDEPRIAGFVRGATVEKKEQQDDRVIVTLSIPINGVTGLNQLVKE